MILAHAAPPGRLSEGRACSAHRRMGRITRGRKDRALSSSARSPGRSIRPFMPSRGRVGHSPPRSVWGEFGFRRFSPIVRPPCHRTGFRRLVCRRAAPSDRLRARPRRVPPERRPVPTGKVAGERPTNSAPWIKAGARRVAPRRDRSCPSDPVPGESRSLRVPTRKKRASSALARRRRWTVGQSNR
jgi:hypothetical protein